MLLGDESASSTGSDTDEQIICRGELRTTTAYPRISWAPASRSVRLRVTDPLLDYILRFVPSRSTASSSTGPYVVYPASMEDILTIYTVLTHSDILDIHSLGFFPEHCITQ